MEATDNVHDTERGAKRLSTSRWILNPFAGTVTFEGRARLPEGVTPPTDFPAWLAVEWEDLGGGVFRYRGTYQAGFGEDAIEDGNEHVCEALRNYGCRVYRCDGIRYEAPDELEDDNSPELTIGELECSGGTPVSVLYHEHQRDPETEAEIVETIKATFGDALTIGAFEPVAVSPGEHGTAWRAPVLTWCP